MMRALSVLASTILLCSCGGGSGASADGLGETKNATGGGGGSAQTGASGGTQVHTSGAGGTQVAGGNGGSNTGGTRANGGSAGATSSTGGSNTGGTRANGGSAGATSSTGGSSTEGTRATGGSAGATSSMGGAPGGTSAGGSNAGGTHATGGSAGATSSTGGSNTGGARATGGSAGATSSMGGAPGGTSAGGSNAGGTHATGGTAAATSQTGGAGGGPSTSDPNVVAITVDPGPSGNKPYIDGAYASVTFCEPMTNNCQTVNHLLIDTGSVGVRVLESIIKLNLPAATSTAGNNLAECLPFLSGTSWGSVRVADAKIGGETASSLRVQLIGETTYALAADCSGTPINDLATLGSNGILGVGITVEDCGTACTSQTTNPGLYYACTAARTGGCAVTTLPVASQIANPIAVFSVDNNGSSIQLPSIPENGAQSVSGQLVFGIGTRSNNGLGSAKMIQSDANGLSMTTFPVGGTAYYSIIDSGSNGLYFLNSTTTKLSVCASGSWTGFYCPQTTTALGASLRGKDGSAVPVSFSVANASKFPSQNCAFSTVGAPMTGYPTDPTIPGFDWGLPFYFGRTVYTAIETKSTPAGTGPYFAF